MSTNPPYERWKPRLRWFLAEFLVVVTGILVAVALNSWWERRSDARRTGEYMQGIIAELKATEAELAEEIETSRALLSGAEKVHNAFFASTPLSMDSLRGWWKFDHADPEPMLGTLRAFVETGDLNLVREDSVRATLVWLAERSRYYDARLRKWENSIVGTFDRLIPMEFALEALEWDRQQRPQDMQSWDDHGMWAQTMRSLPASPRKPGFVTSISHMLDDPEVYEAAVVYLVSTRAHLGNQERLLKDVTTARKRLESAVARN